MTLKLSSDLPELLKHNVPGSVHVGDFVLPMFLFASGLSLAYYFENNLSRGSLCSSSALKDIIGRFIKLAFIGLSLSYFSAYRLLEMDEVMLSAICFLACIFLSRFKWKFGLLIIILINLSYLLLIKFDHTYIFSQHYLGGYLSVPYYLPIMLSGFFVGQDMILRSEMNHLTASTNNASENPISANNLLLMVGVMVLFLLSMLFAQLDKLTASPSFMMLSILVSFFLYIAFIKFKLSNPIAAQIEYIGKNPLRFWVMMYVLLIIPGIIYVKTKDGSFPLEIPWLAGITISSAAIFLLWSMSKLVDRLKD